MKNRILCIALAFSMLATIFVALPTRGAIDHTGSVRTMDNTGHPQDAFFAGDAVYVNATLYERGVLDNGWVRVELQRPDGVRLDWMNGQTNRPVAGYYNSTLAPANFLDAPTPTGPVGIYYVVAYERYNNTLLASVPITVRQEALTLLPEPNSANPYYPGEEVSITWVTTHSTDLFYMHIINETGVTFVNWSRQITSVDGWWNAVWKIDANMPDGTYRIRARSETTHATLTPTPDENFLVQKYVLSVEPERTHYMPGETAKITYLVYETATFMPYPGVTITFSSDWLNSTGNMTWLNNTLVGDDGIQEFVIPTNIALYSDINITYWANESSRSAERKIVLVLDQLSATLSVDAGPYMPGDTVVATVTARVGSDLLSGAGVSVRIERNGTDISAYAANLTTDLQGVANHPFTLAEASPQDAYIVTVVVTKAGYTVTKKASFFVEWDGLLTVQFDKLYYFSGDTASVSFKAVWNNQLIENPSIGYQVFTSSTLLSTGNTTGADISVTIPSDFSGLLSVEAKANHDGNILSDDADVTVYMARIVLTPAVTRYSPGDTVTFNYDVVTGLSSASLLYKITDVGSVIVASDDLTGMSGSFDFVVPVEHPSASYKANVTLTDPVGRYVFAETTVTILQDYALNIWTGKSGYTSGEFKPGQTVKVYYRINSFINEDRPVYTITLWDGWSSEQVVYQVTEASGVLDYTLMKDVPQGELGIQANLKDGVTGVSLPGDSTKIVVNTQLSGWDKSIAGMSASNFIILVLIIIMILLLIVMPFLKGRMETPKAPKPEPVPPPTPEMPKTP